MAEFSEHVAERTAHPVKFSGAAGLRQEGEDIASTDPTGGGADGAQTALEARGKHPANDTEGDDQTVAETQNELVKSLHGGEGVGHRLADDDQPALAAIVAEAARTGVTGEADGAQGSGFNPVSPDSGVLGEAGGRVGRFGPAGTAGVEQDVAVGGVDGDAEMLAAGGFGDHGELHLARPRPADLRAEHTEKGALSGGHGHTEIEKARGIRADGRKFAGELGELAHPADKGLEATATKPSGVTHFFSDEEALGRGEDRALGIGEADPCVIGRGIMERFENGLAFGERRIGGAEGGELGRELQLVRAFVNGAV